MPDNLIQVGARVDAAEFKAGMDELVEATQTSMEAINASLKSATGAFSSLGAILGASVFTEFVDHVKDQALEVGHLSEATGISVVKITGLKDAMAEAGASADRLPQQLTLLSRSIAEAASGADRQANAFRQLGINTDGWTSKMPDAVSVIEQLASHLQHSHANMTDLANMSVIFGRGVIGLTAFLKQNGDQLDVVTQKYLEHGLEVAKSVEAAKQMQQQEAQLKATLETELLPVFRQLVGAIDGIKIMYETTAVAITAFGAQAVTVANTVLDSFSAIGTVVKDAVTGNFKAIPMDAHNSMLLLKADVAAFQQISIDQAAETQRIIAEIMKPKPVAPDGDGDVPGVPDLKKVIEANIARIDADKKTNDAIIQQEQGAIKELEAAHQISDEAALIANKALINEKFAQDEAAESKKLVQLQRDRAANVTQIIAAQGEIKTLAVQNVTALEALDAAYNREIEKNAKEATDKAAENWKHLKASIDQAHQTILESQKTHEQAMGQVANQELQFELSIGKISETAYENLLQQQLTATYTNERAKLEAKKAAAQGNIAEQAKVDAELQKLDDKYYAESEKAEEQSLLRRRQKFDQYFQQISGTFNSAINSWVQGTETASQAFTKMFDGVLSDLTGFVEKWVEKKLEMWLQDKIIGTEAQITQAATHNAANVSMAQSDAFLAAANAYAEYAAFPPLALSMASQAMGTVQAFAAGAASYAIGTNFVPQDGLAMLHRGEEIIPASKQGPGYSGGSGSGFTVVVQHNVNAVDAASFESVIDRHSNMIGNKVAKVLKKKGFGRG
jgi:hypothetical protein